MEAFHEAGTRGYKSEMIWLTWFTTGVMLECFFSSSRSFTWKLLTPMLLSDVFVPCQRRFYKKVTARGTRHTYLANFSFFTCSYWLHVSCRSFTGPGKWIRYRST